jgi:hypothetical protein
VFNPQIYVEAASHNFIMYHIGPINFEWKIELNAFKFTALDA